MSRIAFALSEGGQETLTDSIRKQIGRLIQDLLRKTDDATGRERPVSDIVLVGNTAIHHLFCGIDITPLSAYPFEPVQDGTLGFSCADLGWDLPGNPRVRFLSCLGGFVGSDLLAGILATRLQYSATPQALIDLGTNGEIVVAAGDRILCASTAAGPAFEGARILHGMRAAQGAIYRVEANGSGYRCQVLGNIEPRGICGSGLVDAVAAALDREDLLPSGKVVDRSREIPLAGTITVRQCDVRQLQLAKGAIAAGIRILCKKVGLGIEALERVHLAGAFGNYIDHASAERIGLLQFG